MRAGDQKQATNSGLSIAVLIIPMQLAIKLAAWIPRGISTCSAAVLSATHISSLASKLKPETCNTAEILIFASGSELNEWWF